MKSHENSFLMGKSVEHRIQKRSSSNCRHVCILLNSPSMQAEVDSLIHLWDSFDFTICADGGANRLYDGLKSLEKVQNGLNSDSALCSKYVPTYIKGDLDSLRSDVEAFYRTTDSIIIKDNNQDTNDLQKCLELAKLSLDKDENEDGNKSNTNALNAIIVVFGAFGGRFDQQIASLHALYEYSEIFDRMVLLGDGNCATLLIPDKNNIEETLTHTISLMSGIEGPGCSLLPVGNKCDNVTTTGLKWNLENQTVALGELISSSNCVANDTSLVTVQTTQPLLWCCQIKLVNGNHNHNLK
jgi:thiamine pyrophosphokinase